MSPHRSINWRARIARNERTALFIIAGIIPALVVFLVIITFWTSVIEGIPGAGTAYTFKHYLAVYADPFTYTALLNTGGFAIVTTLVSLLFGVPIAWLAERTTMSFKPLLYGLMVLGLIIPSFFVAMGWILLLHPRIGFLNLWLQQLLGPGAVISVTTVTGMGFVQGLSLAPLAFIMCAAAFKAMNPALEEAAEVHGMGIFTTLRRVTLPLVFPAIAAAAIYIFVIGVAAFDIPAIIGLSNRLYTFSTLIYVKALIPDDVPEYGIPAAVGLLMFIAALALTAWYSRFLRSSERYQIVAGKAYKVKPFDLGRWGNRAAWTYCAIFLFLAIGLPLLLVGWASLMPFLQPPSMRALEFVSFEQFRDLDWDQLLHGAKNTAILMLFVPTVTIILAIPVAWVVVRSGSRWRYVYEFLTFLPHAMPAIIFGVAALITALFILGTTIPLYGTVWLIAIVYIIESITFVSRVLNNTLMQIHKELEEVGYVSGLAVVTVLRRVFVPLVLPAILGIWLWRALVTYRELTVAAVLYNPENITLPVVVWALWTGGGMGPAAAATIVILAVMTPLIMVYWIFVGRRHLGW
jgi:iron(III) transport system permease protein